MAYKNVEVEVKIKVVDKTFITVCEKIAKVANLIDDSEQTDEYFSKELIDLDNLPLYWISLRRRGYKKNFITIKEYTKASVIERKFSHENETLIENPEIILKLFEIINLKKIAQVTKTRKTFKYKSDFEISFDIVQDLGSFIEFEALRSFGSIQQTRDQIFRFIEELQIEDYKVESDGYPILILKKTNNYLNE